MADVALADFQFAIRNQSPEHRTLAARSLRWLGARATGRGVIGSTEIQLRPGYVADAVAICGFQWRFLCGYVGETAAEETVNEFLCIFEVKVSRADFLSTFGGGGKHQNRKEPVGRLHWCVTPRGLVKPEELPDWWGLLEASGQGLREKRSPRSFGYNAPDVHHAAYCLMEQAPRRPLDWRDIPQCPVCGAEDDTTGDRRVAEDG